MTLACAAFGGDLGLSHASRNKVLNDLGPVHANIITYVIGDRKHHRDLVFNHNSKMDTTAERLKHHRERLGLTQSQLAKKAKLKNQSIIGMLESGERKTSSHIPAIAHALGVESLWLSSGQGPEKTSDVNQSNLSETAIKVAVLVNDMSDEQQEALLQFLTVEKAKKNSGSVNGSHPPSGT